MCVQKSKSPIRQSIKNFITVFKKSTKPKGETIYERSPSPPPPPPSKDWPLLDAMPTVSPFLNTTATISSDNSLFYLDRHPHVPQWRQVKAELIHKDALKLSWPGMPDETDGHVISLEACSDVQSIAFEELVHPPPDDALKPFQVLFGGRKKEMFAVFSTLERARWVNEIWLVLLLAFTIASCLFLSSGTPSWRIPTLNPIQRMPPVIWLRRNSFQCPSLLLFYLWILLPSIPHLQAYIRLHDQALGHPSHPPDQKVLPWQFSHLNP